MKVAALIKMVLILERLFFKNPDVHFLHFTVYYNILDFKICVYISSQE